MRMLSVFDNALPAYCNRQLAGSVSVSVPCSTVLPYAHWVERIFTDVQGIGGELDRMGISVDLPDEAVGAYNPAGGKRVQQSWQKYSASKQPWDLPWGHPCGGLRRAACP